ncbi:MAG: holliday junction resolvase, archaea type [archaeon GW2011_AR17]|nr:MAG: holliday junction resolvase, archaea type [archaeon GW2011_AR17]MBS3154480.1 Holliday junction resolvase [Candidatus Woesearchaeota archaeon]HIH15127.1 Holliday junction resolvase [Nanoarchaeota archaeon]HIH59385.1 Holliday junction resolvase [Nanoarchaeota archaeon]HII14527.1 Holliday junction resolvase [Nanoarchaeota archaeon]
MSMKSKGTRAERELFHLLWKENYGVVRSAGSGSTSQPSPDLLASNGKKTFAIECKSVKGEKKYFSAEELEQLRIFSETFGAEAWLAIRFDNKGWFFLEAKKIPQSKGKNFLVSYQQLQKDGLHFQEFLGKYTQEKL